MAGLPDPAAAVPIELGRVAWGRDVDTAFVAARQTGRPVLLLFQEIPGCATCKSFGQCPLSHPLLVDAIDFEFVPVVVYNNRSGTDAAMLQRFGEPAWNNPVLRVFGPNGAELLPRRDDIGSEGAVAQRLVDALAAAGRDVPPYLALAAAELRTSGAALATFAVHCFWEGEAALGGLDGVIATRAGYLDGEAVEVTYLPSVLPYDILLQAALKLDPALRAFTHDEPQLAAARKRIGSRARRDDTPLRVASDSDQKWHLHRSALAALVLTPAQATHVNAELAAGRDPGRWLSPRQRQALDAKVVTGSH